MVTRVHDRLATGLAGGEMQSSILICNNFLMSAGGLAYRTVLFTLVFSQTINRDDSWVKVGELAGKRERNSFLFRLRILLAERNLGGDTPPVSGAGLWLTVRSCTHSGLSSRAALLRRELSPRYEARLTRIRFRFK